MINASEYRGYSLFNDVSDAALRTWNRCVVLNNIKADHGDGFVQGYSEHLTNVDRLQVLAMYKYISIKGLDNVKVEIMNGLHSPAGDVCH